MTTPKTLARGTFKLAGDEVLDLQGQVAEDLLGPVQDLDQRAGDVAVGLDEFFQFPVLFVIRDMDRLSFHASLLSMSENE